MCRFWSDTGAIVRKTNEKSELRAKSKPTNGSALRVIYTSFIHFPRNIPLEPTSGGFASKRRLSTLSRDKSRSTRCSSLCRWAQKCRRQAPKPFRSTGRGTLLEGGWTRKKRNIYQGKPGFQQRHLGSICDLWIFMIGKFGSNASRLYGWGICTSIWLFQPT